MLIVPAIDIRGGKCVRLTEGRFDKETVFADDPAEMAVKFAEAGAKLIHVVDLDGALAGKERNLETIKRILAAVKTPIEVGGGIRSMEVVSQLLDLGVSRVILGSVAMDDQALLKEVCKYFPTQAVVGIDAKNGKVALHGWGDVSSMDYLELGKEMAAMGVQHLIFTDISRDGKLSGVNVEATAALAKASGVKVIASGGIHSLQDIKELLKREAEGIEGCIIGKAIYTGAVDLKAALQLAKE
jgi:phosphoribosylformimino-5-aminoimidazole carboxamide ribotide isomerase